jgi:uncharacterized protein (DUF302 family)
LGRRNGMVSIVSHHSVGKTVARLEKTLQAKGVKLFSIIDHSGEARAAGLQMPETKLLIFGNPKAGTPLMLARPSVAIDLPLKILVAEGQDGAVTVSYNEAEFLGGRHELPPELIGTLAVVQNLANAVAE